MLAPHTRRGPVCRAGGDGKGRVYLPTQSVRVGDDRDLVSVTQWGEGRAAGQRHLWEGPYPGLAGGGGEAGGGGGGLPETCVLRMNLLSPGRRRREAGRRLEPGWSPQGRVGVLEGWREGQLQIRR